MVKKQKTSYIRLSITPGAQGPQVACTMDLDMPLAYAAAMFAAGMLQLLNEAAAYERENVQPGFTALTMQQFAVQLNEEHKGRIPQPALEWFSVIDPSLGAAPDDDDSGDQAGDSP